MYKSLIRPILFRYEPEQIHDLTLKILSFISNSPFLLKIWNLIFQPKSLPFQLWGLNFYNPIGLAAGMDKDGIALPAWHAMGFGFIELGAITWYSQAGNPKPRIFRAVKAKAIINRMGLNNIGAEAFAQRLYLWRSKGLWPNCPVGVNIGKSRITPIEQAAQDYKKTAQLLAPLLDFFVINVSCPNVPDLSTLHHEESLREIILAVKEALSYYTPPKALLIKISPDLDFKEIDKILQLCLECSINGIIATNTTRGRPQTLDNELAKIYQEEGGLSGRPLADKSTTIIRYIYQQVHQQIPIIGVGGIFSSEDAIQKIKAGATLLQLYTGLVFEGPWLPSKIVRYLLKETKRQRLSSYIELLQQLRAPPTSKPR